MAVGCFSGVVVLKLDSDDSILLKYAKSHQLVQFK
jgi:hypothetical protein